MIRACIIFNHSVRKSVTRTGSRLTQRTISEKKNIHRVKNLNHLTKTIDEITTISDSYSTFSDKFDPFYATTTIFKAITITLGNYSSIELVFEKL